MKPDGLFKRNHLAGAAGDAINAVLALAGHNLRLLLAWLRLHCAWILAALRSHLRPRRAGHGRRAPNRFAARYRVSESASPRRFFRDDRR